MTEQRPVEHGTAERRHWLSVLAKAEPAALDRLWQALPERPAFHHLRRPEIGLVMVRGRAGGSGNPFNLGEMTVTLCSVRTADGRTGHGYVAGRDRAHAETVAVLDAMLQDPARRDALMDQVV
ncbi:MAG TPA: phosphonate C-P lyase system protein PhnG, partial [Alphaproteobacteria bacterium]|nr:phosphonate C-P lyase system protein PhnG [Alphaproteobacteria bacterium]